MTRVRVVWFGIWASSLVVAFYLGGNERSDRQPAASTVATRSSLPTQATPRCTIDETAIRRVVSDEVSAKLEGSTPAANESVASRATTESQEPDFDPEVAAHAYKRGSELLDVAIARGAWTTADAGDLRLVILQLPREQRHSLLDRLFGAVNANQLRNDVLGAPI